jgi:hypothetical protein
MKSDKWKWMTLNSKLYMKTIKIRNLDSKKWMDGDQCQQYLA